jgi:hypothetical protein
MKTTTFTKLQATLDSRNFFVSLISLVLLTLEANDLSIGTDADSVYDAFASGELGRILSLVLINFLNPLMKIIRGEAGWSWGFLKSWNFRTQALTAVLIFFTGIGVVFPDGAVANLIDALAGGELNLIIIALVANIINPFIHFFRDKAKDRRREVPGESETPDSPLGSAIA